MLADITVKKESDESDRLQPFEVTELQYKADGRGLLKGEYSQLFLIHSEKGTQKQLTSGPFDHFDAAWSPNGDRIAYCRSRPADDTVSYASDLVIRQLGGEEKTVSNGTGAFTNPVCLQMANT
ncbi:TolB family protein [Fictibacillus sp. NRS-1165]|uniref:TolB family protein n=1 Tax=Fictibacillus sp. NRS-1165 TaxID=3144463 RepID=UPI003D2170E9